MGILNVTPDSFFEGSKYTKADALVEAGGRMLEADAAILDIGGMSSRPGAEIVEESVELDRVTPAVETLLKAFPDVIISVDTLRAGVAKAVLEMGAHIINDISAGQFDEAMLPTVAKFDAPYILMHMQGTPNTMQKHPRYEDVTLEVLDFLKKRLHACRQAGISDCIVDPGFGFGKDLPHNYQLLRDLSIFQILKVPLLAGISRKSMINKVLGTNPNEALNGTTVVNTIALLNGARILRVHDVAEARQVVELVEYYQSTGV